MKRDRSDVSTWPSFDSPLLQEVAATILRRHKAISYQVALSCEREFSETDVGAVERLNLDLQPGEGELRVSVWADGVIWLRLCVAGAGRNSSWAFMDQFYGSIQDVSPEALVAMVEATLDEPYRPNSSDAVEYRERLRATWSRVRPWME